MVSSNNPPRNHLFGLGALQAHSFTQLPYAVPTNSLLGLSGLGIPTYVEPVKRRAFFSFHFDDVMRVNVVRKAWKFTHTESHSFTDSSLWESRQLEGEEGLKNLIRNGVKHTSAVCVLIGSDTWLREWVRYEIARAIIDKRGLLGVHLNSIRHHQTLTSHTRGYNPLEWLAVGKVQPNALSIPLYYLFEKVPVRDTAGNYAWAWQRYGKHLDTVDRPAWLRDCLPGYVTPLSENASVYDFIAENGHKNLGTWIDQAAQRAGR